MQLESTELIARVAKQRNAIEDGLDRYTRPADGCPARLTEAVRYSVLAPGKRLRPLLVLFAAEAVGGNWPEALPAACAIEFIHVYSLIHDDLPAMDDDDLRRGKATCHKQFDEATAILAGDCLQMLAIETLIRELPAGVAVTCCGILSEAAGRCHLVGGQTDDLAAEGRFGDSIDTANDPAAALRQLRLIHQRKTGALINASLQMGGVVGGASVDHLRSLKQYGEAIGLAFQIVDDCLDVEATSEQLGKTTRKDMSVGKLTYPGLLGLSESRQMAEELIREATEAIAVFGEKGRNLADLAQFVVSRRS